VRRRDTWRQLGVYTGRILGARSLRICRVVQASKFGPIINARTARLLGLTVALLVAADEVIE
jgi:putative ABC transport system substrate-binding protein